MHREVDIALAADVGTLQRLHHVIGSSSLARELAYTARRFNADEALACGFVSTIAPDREALWSRAFEMAELIATKSPVAIAGTKANLNYSREHTISDSLDYIATWNAFMLQTGDVVKAAMASLQRGGKMPSFSKL